MPIAISGEKITRMYKRGPSYEKLRGGSWRYFILLHAKALQTNNFAIVVNESGLLNQQPNKSRSTNKISSPN